MGVAYNNFYPLKTLKFQRVFPTQVGVNRRKGQKMYFGIDKEGNRIHISKAKGEAVYTCPHCREELIAFQGNDIAYFKHKNNSPCDEEYEKNHSLWQSRMQELLPGTSREASLKSEIAEGETYIADAIIETDRRKYIIIFQAFEISAIDFYDRTLFFEWNDCIKDENGKPVPNTVIWLFDFRGEKMYSTFKKDPKKYGFDKNYTKTGWESPPFTFAGTKVKADSSMQLWFLIKHRDFIKHKIPNDDGEKIEFLGKEQAEEFLVQVGYTFQDFKFFGGKTIDTKHLEKWFKTLSKCAIAERTDS